MAILSSFKQNIKMKAWLNSRHKTLFLIKFKEKVALKLTVRI